MKSSVPFFSICTDIPSKIPDIIMRIRNAEDIANIDIQLRFEFLQRFLQASLNIIICFLFNYFFLRLARENVSEGCFMSKASSV